MNLSLAIRTMRQLGIRTACRRMIQAAKVRSGYIERTDPARPFGVADLERCFRENESVESALDRLRSDRFGFFFHADQLDARREQLAAIVPDADASALLERAAKLEKGTIRFFSRTDYDMGMPIDWHLNPAAGVRWPNDRHWSRYSQLDPRMGDIKFVWEANRFTFLFDLVRAFGLTGDTKWIELGLQLIEAWIDANPPSRGPNWICGQEISFRLFAWCFLLQAAAPTLDATRFAPILASIYRQTRRVERFIGFARSIRNNHAISEAIGLYTIGLQFPGFDRSAIWKAKGKRILLAEASYQIFSDGSYIQHSMNYHRVMLSDCLWAVRLGQLHGDTFPDAFLDQLRRATAFLFQMADAESGRVPNYGANDGAQVLPLSSCDYTDYRPVIQAMWQLLEGKRIYANGPWDELSFWMFSTDRPGAPTTKRSSSSQSFDAGGYYLLKGPSSHCMVRCHSYIERPAQADMLHVDLTWRGINVLRDSGTFSYNCDAPWRDYFKSTLAHNTIAVEGESQMTKGPRFMWFDWTRSRSFGMQQPTKGASIAWAGEHYGYVKRHGIVHHRQVEHIGDNQWRIVDTLNGAGDTSGILTWHLVDCPYEFDAYARSIRLATDHGSIRISVDADREAVDRIEVVRGASDALMCAGWESVYYGEKSPVPVVRVYLRGPTPICVRTTVRLGDDEH